MNRRAQLLVRKGSPGDVQVKDETEEFDNTEDAESLQNNTTEFFFGLNQKQKENARLDYGSCCI